MNFSGILIAVDPEDIEAGIADINRLSGVEVYHRDDRKGHLVAILEGANVDEEVAGLKRIKALPRVRYAELVYHYLAEDDSEPAFPAGDLDSLTGIADEILDRLNS